MAESARSVRLKIRSPQGGVGSSPTFGSKDLRRFAVSLFFGLLQFFCTHWGGIAVASRTESIGGPLVWPGPSLSCRSAEAPHPRTAARPRATRSTPASSRPCCAAACSRLLASIRAPGGRRAICWALLESGVASTRLLSQCLAASMCVLVGWIGVALNRGEDVLPDLGPASSIVTHT